MDTARNSGGPVKVGSAEGARCENAGGGVNLDNISGSVRVSTAIGSIIATPARGQAHVRFVSIHRRR